MLIFADVQEISSAQHEGRHIKMSVDHGLALSRISPRVRVWVSVSIVYRIATGGYSWIWPMV